MNVLSWIILYLPLWFLYHVSQYNSYPLVLNKKKKNDELDRSVWGSFLGACTIYKDINMACIIKPVSSDTYMILHNMYVDAGLYGEAAAMRRKMEINGVMEQAGYGWMELHDQGPCFYLWGLKPF